jgi:predicted dehydrogenase
MSGNLTRRTFLMGAAAVAAGCATQPRTVAGPSVSPNGKLNMAAIGSGGKGMGDIWACRSENVIALCDVDENQAAEAMSRFPNAKFYQDFRVMLEKEPSIDAVTVSTPDHTHAVAAAMAMRMGKHVYVQKPLTHDIYEARVLSQLALETGVATQMGNQGHSQEGVRQVCEAIWNGDIGEIREVHIWTNRPVWAQGLNRPPGQDTPPASLDWDLWLGTAPERPYVSMHPATDRPAYHPWHWRGWWEFGTGALGDMACHIMDPANWALGLSDPEVVEPVTIIDATEEQAPVQSITRYVFGERTNIGPGLTMPPCTVYWYEGGLMPERPADIPGDQQLGDGNNGTLFVGSEGYLTCGEYGGNPRLLPDARMADYSFPDPWIERVPGNDPYQDWLRACKGGPAACSNFGYAGPFTEIVLLGALAQRANAPIIWDAQNMRVVNSEAQHAQQYVQREYRGSWTL